LALVTSVSATGGGPAAWKWQNSYNLALALLLALLTLSSRFSVPWWRNALGNPVLSWIAMVSYNVYLWHAAVLEALWRRPYLPSRFVFMTPEQSWTFAIVGFALCFGVGALFTYYLERPLLRRGESSSGQ
jgi:peptidoglycan/LPS O-acetylase OafA/YrhL